MNFSLSAVTRQPPDSHSLQAFLDSLPTEIASRDPVVLASHSRDRYPLATKRGPAEEAAAQPSAVLFPTSATQLQDIVRRANQAKLPLVPYGAGSGVVGAAIPTRNELVVSAARLNDIGDPDERNLHMRVGAGAIAADVEAKLNACGFTLGHYPQSLPLASMGGLIATRSTGTFSNRYGGIEQLVLGLEVILPDGQPVSLPARPRAAMGPDLTQLFIGSEGALGFIVEATLRIFPLEERRSFHGYRFPSVKEGLDSIESANRIQLRPAVLRLYEPTEADILLGKAKLPSGGALLIVGEAGPSEIVQAAMLRFDSIARDHHGEALGSEIGELWEQHRYDASWLDDGNDGPGKFADAIEVSASWSELGPLYHALMTALQPLASRVMAHYSHFYSDGGCLYAIIFIEDSDPQSARQRYLACWDAVMDIAQRHGGSLSHHHGVGLARAKRFADPSISPSSIIWRRIKSALDPHGLLAPGKLPSSTHAD